MIGNVHGKKNKLIKAAKKRARLATNGGVSMNTFSRTDFGIPLSAEILIVNVHPEHRAGADDIWTGVFYGYSWDEATDKLEVAVNGRLTGLQQQDFLLEVLYAI